jgi:hypothetical protein
MLNAAETVNVMRVQICSPTFETPFDPAALPSDAGDMTAKMPTERRSPRARAKPRPLSIMAKRPEVSVGRWRKVPVTSSPAAGGA